MSERLKFPEGFLWGAATASYQVEGGIENCDWAKAAREGKVPECGRACDHYNRFREDFDIAKELGHNAHRFSVEWARIEPEEGKFDEAAIAHYREVLQALHERGMEPFVTLWHFTLPQWFTESGGWEREDAPEVFARYCAHVVEKLGNLATHYSTINEPTVYSSNGWIRGTWPPFHRFKLVGGMRVITTKLELPQQCIDSPLSVFTYLRVLRSLARSHNAAYRACKKVRPDAYIGLVKNIIVFEAGKNFLWRPLAALLNWHWTHRFMARVAPQCDEIGLNFYFYKKFGDTKTYDKTDMNWDIVPERVEDALMMLTRYKKPLYVAEAGCADHKDRFRADYIRDTARGIHRALGRGADVQGFMCWSLMDNYEWAAGFGLRFGLVEINYDTLERHIRPSAYVYKEICETNSVET